MKKSKTLLGLFALLLTFSVFSCTIQPEQPPDPHATQAEYTQQNATVEDVPTVTVLKAQIGGEQADTASTETKKVGPFDSLPSVGKLTEYFNMWYGLVLTVLGYFSFLIPGIKKWEKVGARVLAIGFVVGALFLSFGIADVWQLIISFLMTTLIYDKGLSNIFKTRKEPAGE